MTEATSTPARATSEQPDMIGRTLGDFHVLRRIGKGGMGEVYLAEQRSLKRNVALKILRGKYASNPTALQRFKLEAESLAKATHSNIVQVHACDEADGVAYMALEYVEGRNLGYFIRKKGPLDLLLALSFMRQIAAGLHRAHELGIIHRDIKPENVLLNRKGEAKVADFGLSRVLMDEQQPMNLTKSGMTVGTPLYMAPEQIEGKAVDARTDIYSFGVTCYHMLAGAPPFEGSNFFQVSLAHVRTPPTPLQKTRSDVPEALCAVIHKMMAKKPADRYQTCKEILKDLSKIRESISGHTAVLPNGDIGGTLMSLDELEEIPTGTPSTIQTVVNTLAPTEARHWIPLIVATAALGIAVLVLVVGSVLLWLHYRQSPTPPAAPTPVVATPTPKQTDPPNAGGAPSQPKNEKALREDAQQYLNVQTAKEKPKSGLKACTDLGVFYLEQNKLTEADDFFTRLDNMKERELDSFHVLGRLGRAIVLAQQGQAKNSNALFKDVFSKERFGSESPFMRKGFPSKSRHDQPHSQVLDNPQINKWLLVAVQANEKGGVSRNEVPSAFRYLAESK